MSDGWKRLQWEIGKALAKVRRITHPDVRMVLVLRNEKSGEQFVGGDVDLREVPAFLRRAADREETPRDYEDLAAIRMSTGEPIPKKGDA